MKRLVLWLGGGAAVAAALYGLLWHLGARQAEATVDAFVQQAERAGWAVRLERPVSVGGFPDRLTVTMGEVLAQRTHPMGETTSLRFTPEAMLVPWDLDRLTLDYRELGYRIDGPDGRPILEAGAPGGQILLDQSDGRKIVGTLEALRLSDRAHGGPGLAPSLSLERGRVALSLVDGTGEAPGLTVLEVTLEDMRTQRTDLGLPFAGRRGDLELRLSGRALASLLRDSQRLRLKDTPPTPEEVHALLTDWRDRGGRIDLERFELGVTPSKVSAAVEGAAFDDTGEIAAEGRVEIEGVIRFLAEPAAVDLLGQNQVLTAQLVVAGLTRDFGDGRHGVPLDIRVADGTARIGPLVEEPVPSARELASLIAARVGRDWESFRLVPTAVLPGATD